MDFILFLACNQRENGLYYSLKSDKNHTNHSNNTAARYGRTGRGTHEEITDSGNHFVVHGSHDGVFHDIV